MTDYNPYETTYDHDEFNALCDAMFGPGTFDARVLRYNLHADPDWLSFFIGAFSVATAQYAFFFSGDVQTYYHMIVDEVEASRLHLRSGGEPVL